MWGDPSELGAISLFFINVLWFLANQFGDGYTLFSWFFLATINSPLIANESLAWMMLQILGMVNIIYAAWRLRKYSIVEHEAKLTAVYISAVEVITLIFHPLLGFATIFQLVLCIYLRKVVSANKAEVGDKIQKMRMKIKERKIPISPNVDYLEHLTELANMRQKGFLTEEEFNIEKRRIME